VVVVTTPVVTPLPPAAVVVVVVVPVAVLLVVPADGEVTVVTHLLPHFVDLRKLRKADFPLGRSS